MNDRRDSAPSTAQERGFVVSRAAYGLLAVVIASWLGAAILNWTALATVVIVATVVLVAAVASTWRLPSMDVSITMSPRRVERGATVKVTAEASSGRTWIPRLQVTATVGSVPVAIALGGWRRGGRSSSRTSPPLTRGVWMVSEVTLSRTDPLRLMRRQRPAIAGAYVIVHPAVEVVDPGVPIGARADGVVDQRDGGGVTAGGVREFARGDNPRRIDWRASARTLRPMTRMFEDPLSEEAVVVLDTARLSYHDQVEFERAVDLVASLAVALLGAQRRVMLVTGDGPVTEVAPGAGSRQRVLDRLAAVSRAANVSAVLAVDAVDLSRVGHVVTGTTAGADAVVSVVARQWPDARLWRPQPADVSATP